MIRTRTVALLLMVLVTGCSTGEASSPAATLTPSEEGRSPGASDASVQADASPDRDLAISLDPAVMDARYEEGLPLFEYGTDAALDLERRPNSSPEGLIIEDVTYASPMGGRVPAFLITPGSSGSFPGLILMHGSNGDRNDLLRQGQAYARLGVIALLITAPQTRPDPPGAFVTFTESDRAQQIQLIVDLRRGVDVLVEVGADPDRLGYVGYSYGVAMGALLAGVERRIGAYVPDVADGGLVQHFTGPDDAGGELDRLTQGERETWLAAMEPIEPLYFVRHAAPSALLMQNATNDSLVPVVDAERLHEQASDPKEIRWYETDHFLPAEASCEQANWLRAHLGFADGPQLPGCA